MREFGTISLCMIVKNEEEVLGRCLSCMEGIADEIIVVDTGSTDATREIARQYTDKVYDYTWDDDFAAARNESFSHAGMDYVMWLDADDVLLEADRQKLLALKEALNPSIHTVMMKYDVAFDQAGRPTFSYYRERLLLRSMDFRWEGAVHEAISPRGNIIHTDIAVTHQKGKPGDPDRNLRIFQRQLAQGKALVPRERFYYARELMYHSRYREAVQELLDFLDMEGAWLENRISACLDLAACLRSLGEEDAALRALLRSFCYDAPRAEVACELGGYFLEAGQPQTAVFWYETALGRKPDESAGGFVNPDCYGFLPCIQLCVAYDRLGDPERAEAYNERAGAYKPDDPAVFYNRAYFSGKRNA